LMTILGAKNFSVRPYKNMPLSPKTAVNAWKKVV